MGKQVKNNVKGLSYRINDEINGYDSVRIVGENVESKVVSLREAKKLAEQMEMDLIEINPKANPPIMRVGNYEKLIYEMKKMLRRINKKFQNLKKFNLVLISHNMIWKLKLKKLHNS